MSMLKGFFLRTAVRKFASFDKKSIKRFYKNVHIAVGANGDTGYEVHLDQRKLRTPSGKVFRVPHEGLASAIAQEWDSQIGEITRSTMHLTQLCNTVQDNPASKTQEGMISSLLEYFDSDTICYWSESPQELCDEQHRQWGPVLDFIAERHSIRPNTTTSFLHRPCLSKEDRLVVERHLASFNDWGLIGFNFCVENLKSGFLALALADGHLNVEQAINLSLLENIYQEKLWGNVPWYHDVERADLSARVAAGLLLHLTSFDHREVKQKMSANDMRKLAGH